MNEIMVDSGARYYIHDGSKISHEKSKTSHKDFFLSKAEKKIIFKVHDDFFQLMQN